MRGNQERRSSPTKVLPKGGIGVWSCPRLTWLTFHGPSYRHGGWGSSDLERRVHCLYWYKPRPGHLQGKRFENQAKRLTGCQDQDGIACSDAMRGCRG